MTIATIDTLPAEIVRGRGGGGPAPTRTTVAYGFWIFILSDIVMFSALFAAYAVLSGNTAGGPTFTRVNQTGGSALPSADGAWAGEIALDVEWAHAVAPQANILLVEAASASDAG